MTVWIKLTNGKTIKGIVEFVDDQIIVIKTHRPINSFIFKKEITRMLVDVVAEATSYA